LPLFHKLTHVALHGPGINDAGVTFLERHIKTLKCLDLSGTRITGQVGATLAQFTNLEQFYASGTQFDDAGLKALAPLGKTLTCLDLSGTRITGQVGATLAQFTNLEQFYASGTQFDDAGLKAIAPLGQRLERLDLSATRLTCAGLAHLRQLQKLVELSLANIDFAQAGQQSGAFAQAIQHLLALADHLKVLDLTAVGLNNPGLIVLSQLKELTDLLISDNPKAGYDGLKQFPKTTKLARLVAERTGLKPKERNAFESNLGRQLLY
jgi:D-serine deaminase-like pyridoxal phosphate-dependent protein